MVGLFNILVSKNSRALQNWGISISNPAVEILKRPFLHPLVIFKDSVTFFMLSAGLPIQGEIFANSHRHCAMRGGGENGHFWCKKGIGRKVLS